MRSRPRRSTRTTGVDRRRPMKRIRFWGTRGSLPVSLTAAGGSQEAGGRTARCVGAHVRLGPRHRRVCRRPCLRRCRRPTAAIRPASRSKPATANTSCAISEAACGRSDRRRLRATARDRRRPITSSCPTCTGTTSWACRSSRPPTFRATGFASTAAMRELEAALRRQTEPPSFPVDVLGAAARISSSCTSKPDRGARHRGHARHDQAPAPHRRFVRRIASSEREGRRLLDRFRAQARDPRETAGFVEFFRDADVVIFDCDVFARRRHLGQGRLGTFEQRRRRRAVPAGRRAASLPVPSRAGVR